METNDPVTAAIAPFVEAGEFAGAATLVFRRGQVVHRDAIGWSDVAARVPLTPEHIFRIASMTKPIVSVAALMLVEEGRVALDDPITKWAPELASMRVLRSPAGAIADTELAARDITFDDLLTHRSGLTYGDFWPGDIQGAYAALGADIDSHLSPDEWVRALAEVPLLSQPGTAFHYGRSTDLLGFLVARIEDAPLGEVLAGRIFRPLGMADTGFTVPVGKNHRRAGAHGFDDAGQLTLRSTGPGGSFLADRPGDMTYESAGQGLWSTIDDYLRFARLFIGDGAVDSVRLLRPETLARMTTNQLTEEQRQGAEIFGLPLFGSGHGFGFGVAAVLDPATAAPSLCRGAPGTVGWPGAFGGFWQADPSDESVLVFLSHNLVEPEQLMMGIGLGGRAAIERFQSVAAKLSP